jgi:DNA repair photolyase
MKWEKLNITNENGIEVEAQAPTIISASRATDIPAFYSKWLLERLKIGYLKWKNPFNGVPLYVTFRNTRLIVFWSKNPNPIIKYLDDIAEFIPNFYFQFTLNDYDEEKIEPNVLDVNKRIDIFIKLSEKIGSKKVIWRFDPCLLTNEIGVDELLKRIENIGNKLVNYTDKLVFSFADIKTYKKVQNNLRREHVNYLEFNERTMYELAEGLVKLNSKWNYKLATCAEKIDLKKLGIEHNKCIDDDLIIDLFSEDKVLIDFLGIKVKNQAQSELFITDIKIEKTKDNKDKGQREFCGCIISKDIGEYNTCPHLCSYCYANTSSKLVLENWILHKKNPIKETIIGE